MNATTAARDRNIDAEIEFSAKKIAEKNFLNLAIFFGKKLARLVNVLTVRIVLSVLSYRIGSGRTMMLAGTTGLFGQDD